MRIRLMLVWTASLVLCSVAFSESRYFGFFDCDPECMDRVHTFTNLAMIRVHMGNPEKDIDQIQHAQSLGLKVILSYFPDYLEQRWENNTPQQQKEWGKWVKAIQPHLGNVVAIYPYDESYLRAINKVGRLSQVPKPQQMQLMEEEKTRLEIARGRIDTNFHGIPQIYNENFTLIDERLKVPSGYEWVGFDCYKGFDNCQGKSIPDYFHILESKLNAGQKLVAIFPGFLQKQPGSAVTSREKSDLHDFLTKFARYVKSDPRFVAVLVWTYAVYPQRDGTEYRGVKGFDESMVKEYRDVASELGVR